MKDNRFDILLKSLEDGNGCTMPAEKPRYDFSFQTWIVRTIDGERRCFDTEAEAEEFYKEHSPVSLKK